MALAEPGLVPARARTWCRVDLAGGTLDIWPLGLLHPGAATINVAVDLATTVEITAADRWEIASESGSVSSRRLDDLVADERVSLVARVLAVLRMPPCRVVTGSDSPRGAGLGASSALTVALIRACEGSLRRAPLTTDGCVSLARDIEAQLMGLPTGVQDHYPGLMGGALSIRHRPGGTEVVPLAVDLEGLRACLHLVFTGHSHFSAGNNWEVVRARLDAEAGSVERFGAIAAISGRLEAALLGGDLATVGRLMSDEWRQRKQLAEVVATPESEEILDRALGLGAWGGKGCGAGGGGCVAIMAPPEAASALVGAFGERYLAAKPTAQPGGLLSPG